MRDHNGLRRKARTVATPRQTLGAFGELKVIQDCGCPRCKAAKSLVRLPPNFKCADVICDFCGYLGQVKTVTNTVASPPASILGAAWGPQKARMDAGIYFPLYVVVVSPASGTYSIFYLPADLQDPGMFRPRNPLSPSARKAGWQGFRYDIASVADRVVKLAGPKNIALIRAATCEKKTALLPPPGMA